MPAVTAQELIDRAKAASDVQDDFVTTTQWLKWADIEQTLLDAFLLRHGYVLREDQEIITSTGATPGQYTLVDFPDPLAILGVYQFSNGRFRRLRPSDLMDGAGHIDWVTTGSAQVYRLFQNSDALTLELWPAPPAGELYYLRLVNGPELPITALDDEVNYPAGFDERIVLGMARRALAKEETVNPVLETHLREIERHIEEVAANRAFAAHQQIRNVDRVERGWQTYPMIPDASWWYIR